MLITAYETVSFAFYIPGVEAATVTVSSSSEVLRPAPSATLLSSLTPDIKHKKFNNYLAFSAVHSVSDFIPGFNTGSTTTSLSPDSILHNFCFSLAPSSTHMNQKSAVLVDPEICRPMIVSDINLNSDAMVRGTIERIWASKSKWAKKWAENKDDIKYGKKFFRVEEESLLSSKTMMTSMWRNEELDKSRDHYELNLGRLGAFLGVEGFQFDNGSSNGGFEGFTASGDGRSSVNRFPKFGLNFSTLMTTRRKGREMFFGGSSTTDISRRSRSQPVPVSSAVNRSSKRSSSSLLGRSFRSVRELYSQVSEFYSIPLPVLRDFYYDFYRLGLLEAVADTEFIWSTLHRAKHEHSSASIYYIKQVGDEVLQNIKRKYTSADSGCQSPQVDVKEDNLSLRCQFRLKFYEWASTLEITLDESNLIPRLIRSQSSLQVADSLSNVLHHLSSVIMPQKIDQAIQNLKNLNSGGPASRFIKKSHLSWTQLTGDGRNNELIVPYCPVKGVYAFSDYFGESLGGETKTLLESLLSLNNDSESTIPVLSGPDLSKLVDYISSSEPGTSSSSSTSNLKSNLLSRLSIYEWEEFKNREVRDVTGSYSSSDYSWEEDIEKLELSGFTAIEQGWDLGWMQKMIALYDSDGSNTVTKKMIQKLRFSKAI